MKKRQKKVEVDYRHDKCKCGALKLKTSPTCRECYKKNRLKTSVHKKDMKQMGKHLAQRSKKRIEEKKRYEKLRSDLLKLEKKVLPQSYSYSVFLHEGERYLKFAGNLVYPVSMVSGIIKSARTTDLEDGSEMVGLILQVPNPIPNKPKKKLSRPVKKAKTSKPVRRTAKKNARRKPKPNTKTKARPRRKRK